MNIELAKKKYTIIFGSPRKNGNTASLLNIVINELKENNNEIDYYDVYEKNISGCKVCLSCQKDKSRIYCATNDDMVSILNSIAKSDVIVYAAPIYLSSVPGPIKTVMDRTVYSSCKYYGDDPHGPALLTGKKLALITTCGYPLEKGVDLYEEMMKRYCKHCGLEYIGMLAERHRNLKEQFMDSEKEKHAREFAKKIQFGTK